MNTPCRGTEAEPELSVSTVEWIAALKERRLVAIDKLGAELQRLAGGAR